jgi:hypothetical protein
MAKLKLLYGGLKSYLPRSAYSMAAHPVDARYGYAVWMRHLTMLHQHGIAGPFASVVELGPGNSIATGVAALLSGAQRYTGLDVLEHMAHKTNPEVLDEVVGLFHRRAPIPGPEAYPALNPALESYAFPAAALDANLFDVPARVAAIRAALLDPDSDTQQKLRHIVPWDADSLAPGSADLIFTQAVLQEIPHEPVSDALRKTICTMAGWLAPGGIMSHQIDFGIYGLEPWNIHWKWSDLEWKLIRGRRDNFVNREPLSTYINLLRECGMTIVAAQPTLEKGIADALLSRRYRALPEAERRTRSVLVIARKH